MTLTTYCAAGLLPLSALFQEHLLEQTKTPLPLSSYAQIAGHNWFASSHHLGAYLLFEDQGLETQEQDPNSKLTSGVHEDCLMVETQGKQWEGGRKNGKDPPRTEHEEPEGPGAFLVVWQCVSAEACILEYLGIWLQYAGWSLTMAPKRHLFWNNGGDSGSSEFFLGT